jgi:DNA-binding LacI/PurR family transcriptional regulator
VKGRANDVYAGYIRGLEGLSEPLVSEVGEFTVDAGRAGLGQLLDSERAPSAVVAAGEVFALGALQEAKARGLQVPGDLAIIGYTDFPAATLVEPPLTMVSVPAREIGLPAMSMLQELMVGRMPRPRRIVLDVGLVVRASCGPH